MENAQSLKENESIDIGQIRGEVNERLDRAEHTFDRVKKLKQQSYFNKTNFEDTVEEFKDRYEEIARAVSLHRKEGFDMSIPAMMLRNVHPKIVYFQVSQNMQDHEKISDLLNEIEQEVKYALNVKIKDLQNEIYEELGYAKVQKED